MIVIIFILYLLLICCVGIFSNKFVTSQLDFLLAGRRLGPWVTAFSERASGESAWLLLGLPGAAIAIGYGEIWAVIGITIGIISSWFLIAEKLRDETEKLNSLTIPDFLEKKFNDSSGVIRITSALIIGIFFTFYVSAQFHGSGKILNTIFGIEPLYGITPVANDGICRSICIDETLEYCLEGNLTKDLILGAGFRDRCLFRISLNLCAHQIN